MQDFPEDNFSLKSYLVPLTTLKAVLWLICIGLIVYANTLINGFVWDDYVYYISNPAIYTFNIFHLVNLNVFNNSGYYRPLFTIYFSLAYNIFKTNAFFII